MEIAQLTAALQSAICLVVLIVLLLNLWPALRVDAFRQRMFAIRDEVFDYAASGKIAFNDPAYRLLRQSMNGFIRYGHRLTFFRVCWTLVTWRILGEEVNGTWAAKWELALKNIKDERVRTDLENFHSRMSQLVAGRLVLGSPVLLTLLVCCVLGVIVQEGWHNLTRALTRATAAAVACVVNPHLLEEEAARVAAYA